ncbi:MAG: hypothetical protein IJV83_05070 [Clostridia bacterium]|nr:hypothetical protein [Clostridia bacterium]
MSKQERSEKKTKRKKPKAEFDTESTIADMNVEGFKWYNPQKKKNPNDSVGKITFKEYWAMVIGAFRAFWPTLLMIVLGFVFMVLFAYLWLS